MGTEDRFDRISECSICGNDFPESELTRHYRTGRLVDALCADEMGADDYLAIYQRPLEDRRRAKQPVPASENSTGPETRVLSMFPPLIVGSNCTIVKGTGSGSFGLGTVEIAGSLDVGIAGVLVSILPAADLIFELTVLFAAQRPIQQILITPTNDNARALAVEVALLNNQSQPQWTLTATPGSPHTGVYYEWQYMMRY